MGGTDLSAMASRGGRRAPAPARILTVTCLLLAAVTLPASAQRAPDGGAIPEVPGDDIFGFTATTDTGAIGDRGIANELTGFHGRRNGRYTTLANKTEFSVTPAQDIWIAASAFTSYHRLRHTDGMADVDAVHLDGFSAELIVRLMSRTVSNPFALSVSIEPAYAFRDFASGQTSRGYGAAFKIFTDAVIVPDRLYFGANAVWAPARSQNIDDRNRWSTGSNSQLSAALTWQLASSLYAGIEARQLAVYIGGSFKERAGYATYVGPTLLWRVTDKIAFNATWQPQVGGRAADNPGLRYDLDNFERTQYRFKLSVQLD